MSGDKLVATVIILVVIVILALGAHPDKIRIGSKIDFIESNQKLYSENNEELIIRHFFNDRTEGVFVDIGCADYKGASTTFYLEEHLQWSGIGVDAVSDWAPLYRIYRPRTKFCNYLVTDHTGKPETFYKAGDNLFMSSANEQFLKEVAQKTGKDKTSYELVQIPTITLNELLDKHGITKIDFLSLDIEGGEKDALAGFDIERFKPELVCIEAHFNKGEIWQYFIRHGYKRIRKYMRYDDRNWYFAPKNQNR